MLSKQEIEELSKNFNIVSQFINSPEAIRSEDKDLKAYLFSVGSATKTKQTKAAVRCHFIMTDANGNVRVEALARLVKEHIVTYAIPRSRIKEAFEYYDKTKSMKLLSRLESEASNLFSTLVTSGEGGEALLYLLTESLLKFPQIICKMSLKTNPEPHYHGVDGIHASIDSQTGNLALYWGESKLHKKISSAINECFQSIAPFLLSPDGPKATRERDLQLLRSNVDLNNETVEEAIKCYLDPDNCCNLQLEFRAICLIGFDHCKYPKLSNKVQITHEIEQTVAKWNDRIDRAIAKHNIENFVIEVFCIPFPSVQAFRDAFRKEMRI